MLSLQSSKTHFLSHLKNGDNTSIQFIKLFNFKHVPRKHKGSINVLKNCFPYHPFLVFLIIICNLCISGSFMLSRFSNREREEKGERDTHTDKERERRGVRLRFFSKKISLIAASHLPLMISPLVSLGNSGWNWTEVTSFQKLSHRQHHGQRHRYHHWSNF